MSFKKPFLIISVHFSLYFNSQKDLSHKGFYSSSSADRLQIHYIAFFVRCAELLSNVDVICSTKQNLRSGLTAEVGMAMSS